MDQAQRLNLIHRRVVAFLLELTIVVAFIAPVLRVVSGSGLVISVSLFRIDLVPVVALLVFACVRDLFGTRPGKRLVGLQLVKHGTRSPATWYQALARNWAFCIPLMPAVEYAVALKHPETRRGGDRIAGTSIVDIGADRLRRGSWWVWIAIACAVNLGISRRVAPIVANVLDRVLQ
ncbi:MAG: RDD family protein [Pseudomonadota bacterium]